MGDGNELREFRVSRGLPVKEIVRVLREVYPRYDKVLQSKCEHTDLYGTALAAEGMQALYAAFGRDQKQTRHGKHRYTRRIACRLPDADYETLQQHIKDDGYDTVQMWLADVVQDYLTRKERKSNEQCI